jgi:CDP-diglyceride synthetase
MPWCFNCILVTMLLLLSANGAPVLTRTFLKHRYVYPVDGGLKWSDGHRLLGRSKTWRGILSAVMAANLMALLLGIAPLIGVWFALLTMLGDLFASFCKRRLGKQESSRSRGLDTVPESLLPASMLKESLLLSYVDIALIVLLFFLIEEFISPILYKWHIRQRPY